MQASCNPPCRPNRVPGLHTHLYTGALVHIITQQLRNVRAVFTAAIDQGTETLLQGILQLRVSTTGFYNVGETVVELPKGSHRLFNILRTIALEASCEDGAIGEKV